MQNFAVVFDMDGVIVDTEALFGRFFKAHLRKFNHDIDKEFIKSVRALTSHEAWASIKERLSLAEEVPNLVREAREAYLDFLRALPAIEPMPGVVDIIESLHKAKVLLAVASSANPKRIDMFMDALGIREKFKVFVSGDDIKKGKPAPDPYLRAAELLQCDPADCVAIEDTAGGSSIRQGRWHESRWLCS